MNKLICAICGCPIKKTLFGIMGIGPCRDPLNKNYATGGDPFRVRFCDEGQHVAIEVAA